jgi:uncharacterized protein (TIGR04222 family)
VTVRGTNERTSNALDRRTSVMNPLNLRGPEFLKLYTAMFALASIASLIIRAVLRRAGANDAAVPGREPKLDPFEMAYLSGGAARAVQAAVVSMVQRGCVRFRSDRDITAAQAPSRRPSPLELGVYTAAATDGEGTMSHVRRRCEAAAAQIEDRLMTEGLLLPPGTRGLMTLATIAMPLCVMILGVAKVCVGLSRGRPVSILVALLIASLVVIVMMASNLDSRRTTAGAALVRRQRDVSRDARENAYRLSGTDLTMAVAIFGPALLATVPDPASRRWAATTAPR